MRSPSDRLRDIIEAIERIERYAKRGREAFEDDELIQVWVLYHLQMIGEAAARLGREFHQAHPQIPWRQIVAMRNILVHEYFGVDTEEVWRTVEKDLPRLKQALSDLLENL